MTSTPRRFAATDPRFLALVVFFVALVLRLVYLFDIRDNPFFLVPVIDAEYYQQTARALASSGIARAPFQMPPGWPLLLSLLYRVVGPSLVAAHVLQFVLGAGTAALTFLLGRRLGGTAVGLVAAGWVATSKALLFLEADLLATPLCIFLDVVALLALVGWAQNGRRLRDLVIAGLVLGLSAITLPLILIVVPAILVWMIVRHRRVGAAFALVLLVAAPIVPVTVRNRQVSGELVVVSANGGINFWMGNNPDWRRTAALRPGPAWRAMQEMPLREAGIVASSARDRWFLVEGLRDWTRRPLAAIGRTFEKLLLLAHNHEIMRDFDAYYFRDHFSWVLRFPGWNFALLLACAAVGIVFARSRAPGERLVLAVLASYAFGITLFFVVARYRAPLLPILAVFAGQGVVWIARSIRARRGRSVVAGAVVGTAVFALSMIDWFDVDHVDVAEAEYRVATTYEKRGHLQDALLRYDAVLEKDPDHALAAARGAVCAQLLGRAQEAVDRYERLLDRHPDYVEAAVNLANLAVQHGNDAMAEHYFEEALAIDPYFPQAYASYGLYQLQRGDGPGAAASLSAALRYDPTWEALRVDCARALLAAGDLAGARREIDRAAAVLPPFDRVELVRGDVLQASGDAAAARAAWERGLRINPSNQELRARLGAGPPGEAGEGGSR